MTSRLGFAAVVALAASSFLFQNAHAGSATVYDFSWTDGGNLTATGELVLDGSVAVKDEFDKDDVLEFEVELFEGGSSIGGGEFPPFEPDFHALNGMRKASKLAINDFYVSVPFGIRLGCTAGDCLSGEVYHEASVVDFGSREGAQDSFVFIEVPEPGASAAATTIVAAMGGIAAIRRRSRA